MAESVVFSVALASADWDQRKSGWRCEALRIPGAKVERIFDAGRVADTASYEVDAGLHVIRWLAQPPPEITVVVRLDQPLVTEADKLKWQKIAIVGSMAAALLGAVAKAALDKWLAAPPPPATAPSGPPMVSSDGPRAAPTAAPPQTASQSQTAAPSQTSPKRCPPAPRPAPASPDSTYFVELAQSSVLNDAAKQRVSGAARFAKAELGDDWAFALPSMEQDTKVLDDGIRHRVWVLRWTGLPKRTADAICETLLCRDWEREDGGIRRVCRVEAPPRAIPRPSL